MADPDRKNARKTTLVIGLLTALAFLILFAVIVFRGCNEPDDMDDRIDPDDPLPGTVDDTGSHYAPGAVPLLRAA